MFYNIYDDDFDNFSSHSIDFNNHAKNKETVMNKIYVNLIVKKHNIELVCSVGSRNKTSICEDL